MPVCIGFKDQFFWVSSRRFADLLEYGVEVGLKTATGDRERAWVDELREQIPELCRRNELPIETVFPSFDERRLWARVFNDVAYMAFRREIGVDDPGFRDCTAVGDAYLLADMIEASVPWEERTYWDLMTMAKAEMKRLDEERPK